MLKGVHTHSKYMDGSSTNKATYRSDKPFKGEPPNKQNFPLHYISRGDRIEEGQRRNDSSSSNKENVRFLCDCTTWPSECLRQVLCRKHLFDRLRVTRDGIVYITRKVQRWVRSVWYITELMIQNTFGAMTDDQSPAASRILHGSNIWITYKYFYSHPGCCECS